MEGEEERKKEERKKERKVAQTQKIGNKIDCRRCERRSKRTKGYKRASFVNQSDPRQCASCLAF